MRILKYLIIISPLLFYSGCNVPETTDFLEIDIEIDYDDLSTDVKLSEFSDHVQYIALETSENSLIGRGASTNVTENYIIVRDIENCLIFDKQNGNYIRKIGNKGRGPNEYESIRGFVNPIKERVYFQRSQDLLEFGVDGIFLRSIKIPDDNSYSPSQYTFLNDSFIGSFDNFFGDLEHWMTIFNNEEIIQIHPNRNVNPHKMPHSIYLPQAQFYHSNDQLFFKEDYNDTVYMVTEKSLLPYIVFNAGKYSLPYEVKWGPSEKMDEFLQVRWILETETYVFFNVWGKIRFRGIYNKRTEQLQVLDREARIENDIDNFISFFPGIIYKNEMVGYVDAWKVEQWFKDNPDKAAELPPHLKKLKNITENDNPVVMIARLKK